MQIIIETDDETIYWHTGTVHDSAGRTWKKLFKVVIYIYIFFFFGVKWVVMWGFGLWNQCFFPQALREPVTDWIHQLIKGAKSDYTHCRGVVSLSPAAVGCGLILHYYSRNGYSYNPSVQPGLTCGRGRRAVSVSRDAVGEGQKWTWRTKLRSLLQTCTTSYLSDQLAKSKTPERLRCSFTFEKTRK